VRLVKFSVFLIALAVIFGGLIYALEADTSDNNAAQVNKPVPAFSLNSLDEPSTLLTEQLFIGQDYRLLNVWASWCAACKYEHPFLLNLKAQGIEIVGLNYRDQRVEAQKVLAQDGSPYISVIYDPHGELALDLGVVGAPETYLIDAQGQILLRYSGIIDAAVWTDYFMPLLSH
jgi:cytochrome c biogenesis protein CcmG/thiol:disulfide interchange protein DsbE